LSGILCKNEIERDQMISNNIYRTWTRAKWYLQYAY